MSNAIPFVFPVLIEMSPGAGALQINGLLRDLVRVNSDKVAESLGQISLSIVARDAMSARARVESILGRSGKILEVGEPSKLNPRKHLPYRRSFVFTRFGRGRHNQQGGSAAHPAPAAAVAAPAAPAIGEGAGVKESVNRLVGPPPVFADAELHGSALRGGKTEDLIGPDGAVIHCPHCSSTNISQYPPGKYPPNATSRKDNLKYFNYYQCKGCKTNFALDKVATSSHPYTGSAYQHESRTATPSRSLRGYPKALKVHETLSKLPAEFRNSNRGRRIAYDAVEMIRREEGHTPAEILSDAYLDSQTTVAVDLDEFGPVQAAEHKIRLSFPTQESRDKALAGAVQFCEQCSEANAWGNSGVEFNVLAESRNEARSLIEGAIYRMNIRQFSLA